MNHSDESYFRIHYTGAYREIDPVGDKKQRIKDNEIQDVALFPVSLSLSSQPEHNKYSFLTHPGNVLVRLPPEILRPQIRRNHLWSSMLYCKRIYDSVPTSQAENIPQFAGLYHFVVKALFVVNIRW